MKNYVKKKPHMGLLFIGLFVIILGIIAQKDWVMDFGRLIGFVSIILMIVYIIKR